MPAFGFAGRYLSGNALVTLNGMTVSWTLQCFALEFELGSIVLEVNNAKVPVNPWNLRVIDDSRLVTEFLGFL